MLRLGPDRRVPPRCAPSCDTGETPGRHPGPVDDPVDWFRIWDLVPSPEERLERFLARMRVGQKERHDRGPGHRRVPGR